MAIKQTVFDKVYSDILSELNSNKSDVINEELLGANGKPIHMVDTNVEKPDAESGFCLHQPQIKSFALENEVNMAILVSFVFFTMQKQWQDVVLHFDNFMQWVMTTDKKMQKNPISTVWRYDSDKVTWGSLKNDGLGGKNRYIQELWANKKELYNDVMEIINSHKGKTEKDRYDMAVEVWYRVIQLTGLGPIKGAFTVQLMLGQLGCIDSINSIVYEPLADPKLFTRKYTKDGDLMLSINAKKDTKSKQLTPAGAKVAQGYLDFLKAIEKATNAPLSKNIWDVWCDIVAIKINQAASYHDRENIGLILPDKSVNLGVKPYHMTSKNMKAIQDYKEKLGIPTGMSIGADHATTVAGVRNRIGENLNMATKQTAFDNVYNNILLEMGFLANAEDGGMGNLSGQSQKTVTPSSGVSKPTNTGNQMQSAAGKQKFSATTPGAANQASTTNTQQQQQQDPVELEEFTNLLATRKQNPAQFQKSYQQIAQNPERNARFLDFLIQQSVK